MEIKLSELINKFGGSLVGKDLIVSGVAPTNLASQGQITFLTESKYKKDLCNTLASAIIIAEKDAEDVTISKIITDNPYWYFSKVSQLFNPRRLVKLGIKPTVICDDDVQIGDSPAIADYVVIGKNSKVGKNSQIHPHVVIGENVAIGDNITIYPNVTIYDNVTIGDNCVLHSGVVVGSDGFGNAPDNKKQWSRIPQIGGVVIGNCVEIGANTTIDCGTFTPTIIHDGVVIDNLVQIAHNVEIGAYSGVAACVGIAGSAKIGKHCQLAGGCGITGHVEIADYTVIGGATGISKSITKPDLYMGAYPFSAYKDYAKNAVHLKNLHGMHLRIKELEHKTAHITGENDDNA